MVRNALYQSVPIDNNSGIFVVAQHRNRSGAIEGPANRSIGNIESAQLMILVAHPDLIAIADQDL